MSAQKRSIFPGIILVLIGVLILIHKLNIYHIYWRDIYPLIFIGLGVWFFVKVIFYKQAGQAFPAVFFLLLGLLFFFRNHYYFHFYYIDEIWPTFLIIFGLAFIVQFLFRPKDWGLLIPGVVFLLLGFGFLARNMRWIFPFEFDYYLERYWPAALILIGIGIILSSLKRSKESG